MLMLKNFLKKIQTEKKIQTLNEEATKQSIILPILQMLGWEVFDTDEVSPEFSLGSLRVDYALRNGSGSKVFIEVKRLNLDLERHQEQLLTYSFRQGVNLSILTNGIVWWFYLPLQEGSWEQRKFYAIDMYSQSAEKIAQIFEEYLTKDKVISGEAIENAKKLYGNRQKNIIIKRNIPKAWKKLLIDGDELLIELLAETTEKICGHRPDNQEVSKFLSTIIHKELTTFEKGKENITNIEKKASNEYKKNQQLTKTFYSLDDDFTYKKVSSFIFQSKKIPVSSWKDLLVKFLEVLNSTDTSNFNQITTITGRKKPYFTTKRDELRRPIKIDNSQYYVETNLSANFIISLIKDVLKLFNYQNGDLKINLRS